MFHEQVLGRPCHALLLATIDTRHRSAVVRVSAHAHFDDHQRVRLAHHQIELAQPAAIVLADELETMRLEKTPRDSFRVSTAGAPVHGSCNPGQWLVPPGAGAGGASASMRGRPSLMTAQSSSRRTRPSLSTVSRPVTPPIGLA